ncbi:MAG TPA: Flp pilus assembly protein CpaB [Chloroflexaceae bacterium]|nr:Flp pilus assembly protein CpaB [Chloroflexaceae bacterium]
MARAKGWIWISLALVCAVSAGGLSYYLLQRQNAATQAAIAQAQQAVPEVETVAVPVAARSLERSTTLTAADIELKEFPLGLTPASALTDPELLAGRILSEPLAQGDFFRESSLYGNEAGSLSETIAPGKTVIAFPIVDLFSTTGLFVEDDRVDLLLSFQDLVASAEQAGGPVTGYTVQNARVVRILTGPPSQDNPNPPPTALLLELDPSDAVMVKKVKDSGGTIDLALRSPLDNEPFDVSPVTNEDLIRLMGGDGGGPETTGNAP